MAIEFVGFDESLKKQKACRHCGAIHRYMPNDVLRRKYTDLGGCSEIVDYIVCTKCGKNIDL